jgi:hypothetical protein
VEKLPNGQGPVCKSGARIMEDDEEKTNIVEDEEQDDDEFEMEDD